MIDTQHDQPLETASATAPAVDKSAVAVAEKPVASDKSSSPDDSTPKQEVHWFKKGFRTIGEGIGIVSHGARNASIAAMPNVVVNNASNLAGALHMVSEVAMYKANGTMLMQGSKGRLVDYIICPPKNIFNSMMGGVNLKFSFKELLKPSSYVNAIKAQFDYNGATREDLIKNELTTIGKGKLVNHWQARSTMMGMTVWGLNMFLPDVKDTPEETERMSMMATNHPVKYVATRLKQALWVPDWFTHKRQMTGLGVMIAGICSFLGGWRNVDRGSVPHKYYFNPQYAITGLISFAASIPLLFAVDNDKGYSLSGLLHLGRCIFLPGSIMKKYKNNEKGGAHYYALGHLGLQSENLAMALVGGAEKDADGKIVDHKAMREEAKAAALQEKAERPHRKLFDTAEEAPARPVSKVTHAGDVALAMPERHSIAKAEQRETVSA